MTEDAKGTRARVMMPGMPGVRRAPAEAWELPLKLLVLGDFTQRADPRAIEDRKPIKLSGQPFEKVMSEQKLALSLQVPDGEGREIAADLRFRRPSDLTVQSLTRQVPALRERLDQREALTALKGPISGERAFRGKIAEVVRDPARRERLLAELGAGGGALVDEMLAASQVAPGDAGYEVGQRAVRLVTAALVSPEHEGAEIDKALVDGLIAGIDLRLQGPVNAMLEDPRLQRLAAAWQRLGSTALGVDPRANVRVEMLNASKEDLLGDCEDAADVRRSGLFKILYTGEYGGAGGQPYGAVLLDEPLGAGAADLRLLQSVLRTAAHAHALVVVRPSAELAASDALGALRATEEGRYLGLGEPEVAGPALAAGFARHGFGTGVDGIEPLLAVAARVACCLKVRHRYGLPGLASPAQSEAFHQAWLDTLAADPDDGERPFRAARLQVSAEPGGYDAFQLALDVRGDGALAGGTVAIRGWLDRE